MKIFKRWIFIQFLSISKWKFTLLRVYLYKYLSKYKYKYFHVSSSHNFGVRSTLSPRLISPRKKQKEWQNLKLASHAENTSSALEDVIINSSTCLHDYYINPNSPGTWKHLKQTRMSKPFLRLLTESFIIFLRRLCFFVQNIK
mgnify:CR=1 FL=1